MGEQLAAVDPQAGVERADARHASTEQPVTFATIDQVANVVVTVVPVGLVAFAAWRAWGGALRWPDVVAFALTYVLTGAGITVGFHRLLTHRSFKTSPVVRGLLAALGSAAVEGPVIEWVANHRKHHRFSDQPGDPHSPHVDHASGWRGAFGGLFHAHLGWILGGDALADEQHYAKDLLADPVVRFVDRTFVLWVFLGLAFPFGLGFALTGTIAGALTALLWGGAVRMFCLHHATFSINSLCHFFGRRSFATERRVAQPAVAGAADARRGVAQQPPRLPDLRASRPALVAARSVGVADRGHGANGPRMGRDPRHSRARAGEARRRWPLTRPPVRARGVSFATSIGQRRRRTGRCTTT